MKKYAIASVIGAGVIGASLFFAQSAQAFQFTYSDSTKQPGAIINLRGGIPIPGLNISINGGLGIAPNNLGSIIKPEVESTSPVNINWDVLLDTDINVAYDWTIMNAELGVLGSFKPTLSPYLGYRHMFTWSGRPDVSVSLSANPLSVKALSFNTQLKGVNFGLKLGSTFPLGFSAYADAGATALIGGNYSGDFEVNGKKEGSIDPKGNLLPRVGLGARWSFMELASLYAGYDLMFLPNDLRFQKDVLSGDKAMVHSLNLGFSLLFFSI